MFYFLVFINFCLFSSSSQGFGGKAARLKAREVILLFLSLFSFPCLKKVQSTQEYWSHFLPNFFFFWSFLPQAKDSTTFQLFSQTENLAILYHYSRAFGKSYIQDIITCLSFLEVQCLVFLLFACLTVPVLKVLLLENHLRKISIFSGVR